MRLQRELNRVRPMYGLPADVTVDGVIGTSTLAKLMKLAVKFVGDRNSAQFDGVFDKYAIEFGGTLPTPAMLAADALNVAQALERDGLTMQHYWAREDAAPSTATTPTIDLRSLVAPFRKTAAVGPTAPPAPVLPSPATSFKTRNLAIAGAVVGVLAIGGIALVAAKRR